VYSVPAVVPQCNYPRDAAVQELFESWAELTPDAVAVRCEDGGSLTYAELNRRANRLAASLRAALQQPASYVGILLPRSEHAVTAMLGILKAGAAYVPLDPRDPQARRERLCDELGIRTVVTQTGLASEVGRDRVPVLIEGTITGGDEQNPTNEVSGSSVAYVLFTSGSTGAPKGVAVPHRAIVRLVVGCDFYPFSSSDRVLQGGPLTFDASTLEVWAPLLTGGRVVMISQETMLCPEHFEAALHREGITALFLTTALFQQMAAERPELYAGLRCVIFGGETCDARWVREVLQRGRPERLVHAYGPTENTVFSTTYRVEEVPDDATSVPIGWPVHASTAHILDADGRELPPGEVGELYVGGDGVALGYVNCPELTAQMFVPDPFSPLPGARLYRTGDYARRRTDGALEFCGRHDHQVKIRGFRIDLSEIEAVVGRYPGVRGVVAVVREESRGDKRLIAYVTGEGLTAAGLRGFVAQQLPAPMVPSAFVVLERFPLTAHGKVNRTALPAPMADERRNRQGETLSVVEAVVAELWTMLLGVEGIDADDDFFVLGGHSLLAARMVIRARDRFGIDVRHTNALLRQLLARPTLRDFAQAVQSVEDAAVATRSTYDFEADATLDDSLVFDAPLVDPGPPQRVFLTGVSGFLGAFLLHELLERTDSTVYCHIRARNCEHGLSRIRATLESYRMWSPEYRHRVVAVAGDLARPHLGLPPEEFNRLANEVDLVIHNGAHVNFIYSYDALQPANVGGTNEVIRLATQSFRKPLHFVSSLGVLAGHGLVGARWVYEDTPLDHPERLHLGYLESKYVAERLVAKAGERGLPVAIYRPMDISGHQHTGVYKTDGTFVCEFVQAVVELGSAPAIYKALDFVPVDYVSGAIVHIATTRPADGSVYHLNNQHFQFFEDLWERLRVMGYPLETKPYDDWVEELLRFVDNNPESPFAPYAHLFVERHLEELHPQEELSLVEMYYQGTLPRFDCSRTLAALDGSGISCPPVDAELLDRYLRYFIEVGFLPPPAVEMSRAS